VQLGESNQTLSRILAPRNKHDAPQVFLGERGTLDPKFGWDARLPDTDVDLAQGPQDRIQEVGR
jgi:hypothetical protein